MSDAGQGRARALAPSAAGVSAGTGIVLLINLIPDPVTKASMMLVVPLLTTAANRLAAELLSMLDGYLRERALRRYVARLRTEIRAELEAPGVTDEERADLQGQLRELGRTVIDGRMRGVRDLVDKMGPPPKTPRPRKPKA